MKLVRPAAKKAISTVRKHPVASAAGGGYVAGVTHNSGRLDMQRNQMRHSHPEFYDRSPNNGRSEDRHPYGRGYGE